jgi:hypothetical protein
MFVCCQIFATFIHVGLGWLDLQYSKPPSKQSSRLITTSTAHETGNKDTTDG